MLRDKIGEVAGKIWQVLGKKGEISLAQLPKVIDEKSDLAYQGLGWLAHEGKVFYTTKDKKHFVALTTPEQDIYKTIN
ncbi:hypothetical protein A2291_03975 [candidate division WOR-1 bacterium RIFOXYB2_FULL_42_35]|uniref:Winged helix-turn-helix domain-containing protein n=1 Tax=candidate division WOR-1 bacterium RIFOXYC2_FULL_41_25 TaxID=1802586 RepID=A0A1F4TNE2_UNCSA|nr:MAG: hypothetical protein A2247_00815 [candidate division WOR-1 bacterium RIFOXYA2_FULL_41_14]OGC24348.1 MAG: hypothetical protein A2291_03975 [candidate division WOR-1 bacterium RIFOXYB2_FULL_42_35]OGC34050.1 MAG: hypothetical protein A2462_01380 [candidate division WOR-1 bacterium RIFOXYC2_FULL_41_25]OGC43153.1 MAG: hypothetical protein A2548_01755 [candidate division WOR-1 bacterium RIFOXYD2_FULL_41_8]